MDVRVTNRPHVGVGSPGKIGGGQAALQLQGEVGHYLLSDHPLTEQEWIEQRASIGAKDVTPASPDDLSSADKSGNASGLEDAST